MATLDQLPADKRAIIELVLRRGQSYEELSSVLGMTEGRVREHAREALASLAPRSAGRVDPHWRGQIADYVLGQQAGPEAKATRSHLTSSEAARTWALSVLDSVGHLYPNGAEPSIPDGGRRSRSDREAVAERPSRARQRPGEDRAARAGAGAAERDRPRRAREKADDEPSRPARRRERWSAYAGGDALTRRRRIAAALAAAAVAIAAAMLVIFVFGGDDESETADEAAGEEAAAEPQVVAELVLRPVGNAQGRGGAIIAEQGEQPVLLMQAKLRKLSRDQTYVVWLYNSPDDALPVAVPTADRQGNVQALTPLPADYQQYQFIDVSLQERSDRANHSGNSVLRAPVTGTEATGAVPPAGELTAPAPPVETAPPVPDE